MQSDRRGEIENVRVRGLLQIRQTDLRAKKRAPRVDGMHQVKALHRRVSRSGQADGARIINENIDPAETSDGFLNCSGDSGLVANIDGHRKRLAASFFD